MLWMQKDKRQTGFWLGIRCKLDVLIPGCCKYSIDNRVFRILGAHEKNILWKQSNTISVTFNCEWPTKYFKVGHKSKIWRYCNRVTYVVHQSVCRCRSGQERNILNEPLGRWSICSPNSCGLQSRSVKNKLKPTCIILLHVYFNVWKKCNEKCSSLSS